MIDRENRFKSWDGFIQIVLKQGISVRGESLSLKFLPDTHPYIQSRYKKLVNTRPKLNSDLNISPKFAVIVSKKVSKSAVKRNRIRRRVYEWVRLSLDQLASDHLVLIFVQHADLANCSHQELGRQLKSLFSKANLLTKPKK